MSQSGRTIIGGAMHVEGATFCEHQSEVEKRCREKDNFCILAVGKTRVGSEHLFNHLNQNTSHNNMLKINFRKRQMQSSQPDPKCGICDFYSKKLVMRSAGKISQPDSLASALSDTVKKGRLPWSHTFHWLSYVSFAL